jgi:lysophospholipase L1-like esterase
LALALAGSLVLNYFFYKRAFIPLQSAKLDPIGLDYYSSKTSLNKSEGVPEVMFYGDSRALSWAPYKTTEVHFTNRAIGNQTSTQIVQRFQAHAAVHKPQVLLVQMCVNDLKMIPLFPAKSERIVQDCKDNIQLLINEAKQINSKVVLTTVFPLGDISVFRNVLGITELPIIDGIAQVNEYIKTLASDDILIFDSYKLLAGEDHKINPDYSSDWLHLNITGYKHLNSHLSEFLKQKNIGNQL